jgi:hypothetical protein
MYGLTTFTVEAKPKGRRCPWVVILTTRALSAAQAKQKAEAQGLLQGRGIKYERVRARKA